MTLRTMLAYWLLGGAPASPAPVVVVRAPEPVTPMTPEEAQDYLTTVFPCGCQMLWFAGDVGLRCELHGKSDGPLDTAVPPEYLAHARRVLTIDHVRRLEARLTAALDRVAWLEAELTVARPAPPAQPERTES